MHRIVMEAKFNERPNDKDVAGSPIVANLARKVVAALTSPTHASTPGIAAASEWEKWLRLEPSRREWQVVIDRGAEDSTWESLSAGARRELVVDLLSPLTASERAVAALVEQIVAARAKS